MAAIRSEELYEPRPREAEVVGDIVAFPTGLARARAARATRIRFLRRRVAVGAFLVVVVAGMLSVGGTGNGVTASAPGAPETVTLRAGETLWGVAQRYGPEGADLRAYVDAIVDLNDLAGPPMAGMRLELPR